jgi:hypothetical protein
MSATPFDVQPIIDRLQARVSVLRQVAGAADFASVSNLSDFPAPCAYVLLARELPDAPSPPGHAERGQQIPLQQRVPASFGVVVVARNYRAGRGAQMADELRTVLGQVRAALLGYVPDVAGARPCYLQRGELTRYDASTALWTDVYQTQHFIGGTP